jgi:hypothetical protein
VSSATLGIDAAAVDVAFARVRARRRWFFFARVASLLTVLALVLLYAWNDRRRRLARTEWKRPLNYALVLVRNGPVPTRTTQLFDKRVAAIEQKLDDEYRRRGGAFAPFHFAVFGPVDTVRPPPEAPEEGLLALVEHTWARFVWQREIDGAISLDARGFDGRVYVVMKPASGATSYVEGLSELGGVVGMASVEIDESSVDFALIVTAHELMHTLGATDKYDATGHTRAPDGLAEPELSPLYPQRYTELMARGRSVAPGVEEPPSSIAEVRIGDATAREIGWLR